MQVPIHFPPLTFLFSSFHRKTSCILPTGNSALLPALLATSSPKSSKTQPRRHLYHGYDCFHMHTQTKHKLIALSLHSHHQLCPPLRLSPIFVLTTPLPSLGRMSAPKLNPFPIKSNSSFDVLPPSIHCIALLSRRIYATLGLPPLVRHPTSISPPPTSDKSGILDKSGTALWPESEPSTVQLLYCYCESPEHSIIYKLVESSKSIIELLLRVGERVWWRSNFWSPQYSLDPS